MKLLVLTSSLRGTASRCLPELAKGQKFESLTVVYSRSISPRNRKKQIIKKFQKTLKIGPLGAVNGVRIRKWYVDPDVEDLRLLCGRLGIKIFEVPTINCAETREVFQTIGADLGLSLGNSYISEKVFSIPRYGMINSHGEILPQFQGAQSVIWSIYEGLRETGFTIHEIDKQIDHGKIIYQHRIPITFQPTLQKTVEATLASMRQILPERMAWVCQNFHALRKEAKPQGHGTNYTTPSFLQFVRMTRNNQRLFAECSTGRNEFQK